MSDDEPLYAFRSPESLVEAVAKAKARLPAFQAALTGFTHRGAFHGVKVHFPHPDGQEGLHIWLRVNQYFADLYFSSLIERSPEFVGLKMDETKLVGDDEVEDWMILDRGTLFGGFSFRAIRDQMPEAERVAMDEHMGVTAYADENAT
jgi:uncharacterized protein YegJ (DUF2314 family)